MSEEKMRLTINKLRTQVEYNDMKIKQFLIIYNNKKTTKKD